ncbi:hypothetical protein ACHAWF_008230 [Thalassiosira exigua]
MGQPPVARRGKCGKVLAADEIDGNMGAEIDGCSSADAARECFEARLRRKADSGGARERSEAAAAAADVVDIDDGEELTLEPTAMATRRSLSADAARERFEAQLRRKADSGGQPAQSPAAAARGRFEDRLRRKADWGGRPVPPPLPPRAAAAPEADIDKIRGNSNCDRTKGALEAEERGSSIAARIITPTSSASANMRGEARAREGLLDLGALREIISEAQDDLRRVEKEQGSHPRFSRIMKKLSSLEAHIRPAVETVEVRPLLEGDTETSTAAIMAEGQDDSFVENDCGGESRGTNLDSSSPENSSRDEECLGNCRIANESRSSAEISQRNGLDTCHQGEGAVDRGGTRDHSQPNRISTWRRMTTLSAAVRALIHGASTSIMQASVRRNSLYVVQATLVEEEDEGEVYVAERIGFWDRKAKRVACAMCAVVAILTVSLLLALTDVIDPWEDNVDGAQPSLSPTFDPRPTLEIVQDRGLVRCGLDELTLSSGDGFKRDLCRSIAAVVLGNPDSFLGVEVTGPNRWKMLRDGTVDLLIYGDTHTLERETRESSTGVGFAFSSPYQYDGMVYSGNATFVKCAEESKRHGECLSLSICVEKSTTHYDFVRRSFPHWNIKVASTYLELLNLLHNGECNVFAKDRSFMQRHAAKRSDLRDGDVVGKKLITKEPLAMVTRNTDRMWSDTVNWVIQAIIYAEEQGLTKDSLRCQISTTMTLKGAADLDFMNAVYCVAAINDVSFYAMATREDDAKFSSFINMIVLATIYAQENGITKDDSKRMPLVSLFGPSLYWSLRGAISYSGNYDEIYWDNFDSVFDSGYPEQLLEEEHLGFNRERGRNILNEGGPMLLSFPHLP